MVEIISLHYSLNKIPKRPYLLFLWLSLSSTEVFIVVFKNLDTIKLTLKCTLQWFLVYSESCRMLTTNYITSSLPHKETPYLIAVTSHFASMDLSILDISYMWQHTNMWPFASGLFHLSHCFKVQCSMNQYFTPFYGWLILGCMEMPYFMFPFISLWDVWVFHTFWILWIMIDERT